MSNRDRFNSLLHSQIDNNNRTLSVISQSISLINNQQRIMEQIISMSSRNNPNSFFRNDDTNSNSYDYVDWATFPTDASRYPRQHYHSTYNRNVPSPNLNYNNLYNPNVNHPSATNNPNYANNPTVINNPTATSANNHNVNYEHNQHHYNSSNDASGASTENINRSGISDIITNIDTTQQVPITISLNEITFSDLSNNRGSFIQNLMSLLENTNVSDNVANTNLLGLQDVSSVTTSCMFHNIENPNTLVCPISLEAFRPNDEILKINRCGHYFKSAPLRRWFLQSSRCPVCRCNLSSTSTSTSGSISGSTSTSTSTSTSGSTSTSTSTL